MRYRTFDKKNIDVQTLYNTPAPQKYLKVTKAYILGALHDSTERKYTYRISQKSKDYVEIISKGIKSLGFKSWTYREGKDRNVYVVEFSKKVVSDYFISTYKDKTDYIRGYFDAEGCIPRNLNSRYYIYFAQKNKIDLLELRSYLIDVGIQCGKVHNPSKKIDPDYYRFYVLAKSHKRFSNLVGSLHPEKSKYLRMKI